MTAAAWWLLWGTALLLGLAYLRECRLRDRAERRLRDLDRHIDALSCSCGEACRVRAVCTDAHGWHHCVHGRCRPLHEQIAP